jgi:hypothetical protein
MDGYLEFLVRRDGEIHFARRTLSHREAFFDRLARDPVRAAVPIDREGYLRNLVRRRPDPGLHERTLWLLATAKANQAERFGVGLAELYGRVAEDSDPVRVRIQLEEFYHTRLLAEVIALFGLPVHARPPALFARLIVKLIVSVPEAWNLPLTGCAEMVGCVILRALRDRGVALFADEPRVSERIGLLYDEILADELGHVGFVASLLGPRKRSLMRALFRLLGSGMAGQLPELVALFGRTHLRRRFAAFEMTEMVAELPGRAFAAASI